MKINELKEGLLIINNENPEWGSFRVLRLYDKGIWEIDGDRGGRVLFDSEAHFWDIVK